MTKQDGINIREARRARVRMIRARVIGGSVALFLAVWSLIAVVLITGHDPALARQTATNAAADTTTSASSGTSGTSGSTSSGSSDDSTGANNSTGSSNSTSSGSSGATSSSTGSGSSAGSAVTSSQS